MAEAEELRRLVQVFVRRFGLLEQGRTPCGVPLAPSAAHALQLLGERGVLPQRALAAELRLDPSTVSRLVERLVDQGWVTRATNPANRREVRLGLSAACERALGEVLDAADAKYHGLWGRIPAAQRPWVLAALGVLNEALDDVAGDGGGG